jgi:hypothetical protein
MIRAEGTRVARLPVATVATRQGLSLPVSTLHHGSRRKRNDWPDTPCLIPVRVHTNLLQHFAEQRSGVPQSVLRLARVQLWAVLLSSPQSPHRLRGPPSLYPMSAGRLFRRLRSETDHSAPSSTEVKNGGAIPPLTHMSSWHSTYAQKQL